MGEDFTNRDGYSVCKGIKARKNVSLIEEQYVQ